MVLLNGEDLSMTMQLIVRPSTLAKQTKDKLTGTL